MKVYDEQTPGDMTAVLGEDVCTFSMLARIVRGKCAKTVTDHARVIMCLSVQPFPVWVWTAPDAPREELECVRGRLLDEFPPEAHTYNVGAALARVMMDGDPAMRRRVSLLAYRCCEAIAPGKTPGGCASPVREEEIELAAQWYRAMHLECALNEEIPQDAACSEVENYVSRKAMFFWRDEAGVPMAMCGVNEDDANAYVTHVYTPPHARRRGYAGNLVYAVSRAQLDRGRMPMLYTDAENPASNACYTRIGYVLQGELATIGR